MSSSPSQPNTSRILRAPHILTSSRSLLRAPGVLAESTNTWKFCCRSMYSVLPGTTSVASIPATMVCTDSYKRWQADTIPAKLTTNVCHALCIACQCRILNNFPAVTDWAKVFQSLRPSINVSNNTPTTHVHAGLTALIWYNASLFMCKGACQARQNPTLELDQ